MDTMVSNIGRRVVLALEAAGYAESTMGQYRKSLRYLALLAQKQAGVYSPGLGAEFASMTTSPRTGMFSAQRRSDYGRLVRLFDEKARWGWGWSAVRGFHRVIGLVVEGDGVTWPGGGHAKCL
jgi:hypothetical protein